MRYNSPPDVKVRKVVPRTSTRITSIHYMPLLAQDDWCTVFFCLSLHSGWVISLGKPMSRTISWDQLKKISHLVVTLG